jgi:hypothetical protein
MNLLTLPGITTAIAATAGQIVKYNAKVLALSLQANLVYSGGGTSVDAYVQSTLDGGVTWFDIANFHFTTSSAIKQYNLSGQTPVTTARTPSDGSLASNTSLDGIWGNWFRAKYVIVGTYTGINTLSVDMGVDLA